MVHLSIKIECDLPNADPVKRKLLARAFSYSGFFGVPETWVQPDAPKNHFKVVPFDTGTVLPARISTKS